jgi:hypothetical protein
MDSRHKISINGVTIKEPHSLSFALTLGIISLVVILLALGTVQAQAKNTQIPSSLHSPILTTSLQPNMHIFTHQIYGQFIVVQRMDPYLEVILVWSMKTTKTSPTPVSHPILWMQQAMVRTHSLVNVISPQMRLRCILCVMNNKQVIFGTPLLISHS